MGCKDLAATYIRDPVQIMVGTDEITTNSSIAQKAEVCATEDEKKEKLKQILGTLSSDSSCIVFCNSKKKVRDLCWELGEDKWLNLSTVELHGDLKQSERD